MSLAPDIQADHDAIFGSSRWIEPAQYGVPVDQCFTAPMFRCEGMCRSAWPIRFQMKTKCHRFCPESAPPEAIASTDLMLDIR